MELTPAQKTIAKDKHRFRVVNCGRRFGKALDIETPILTTDGFKKLKDIVTGDVVFGEDGKGTVVTYKSPIYTDRTCYKVIFSDGSEIVADASHDWVVESKAYRKNVTRTPHTTLKPEKKTTEEIKDSLYYERSDGKREHNWSIPTTEPLVTEYNLLPVEPYFLGLWLGDGSTKSVDITTVDEEVVKYLYEYADRRGVRVNKKLRETTGVSTYAIVGGNSQKERNTSLQNDLRVLGVLNNKHIPDQYLFSGYTDRINLLKGLMDSDGYCRNGFYEYTTIKKKLANSVYTLLMTLGIKASVYEYDSFFEKRLMGKKYRIHFSTDLDVFNIERKKEQQKTKRKSDIKRRFIVSVEKVKSRPVQCLRVDNPTHLFLAGTSLIPTHNTTLAAYEMLAFAVAKSDRRIAYYAPTRDDARDIVWSMLLKTAESSITYQNESRLELKVRTQDGGESQIVLYGWEAVQERGKGRGVKNDFIVLDEVAMYRNFGVGWEEVLSPTLTDTQGHALYISTPKGFNHFYDLFNAESNDDDYKSFHYTSYDNPHLPVEELDKTKERITEDRFAQEYMADFRKTEGLVYKEFNRGRHVYKELPFTKPTWVKVFGGHDFGYTNPCASITVKKDRQANYYVTDEWYKTRITEAQQADYVAALKWDECYPDPESPSGIEEMKRRGVNVREVIKNRDSIRNGINVVRELLKTNRLKIHESCKNLIWEMETYAYPDKKPDRNEEETPIKENDHACDALRYALSMDNALTVEQFHAPIPMLSTESEVNPAV